MTEWPTPDELAAYFGTRDWCVTQSGRMTKSARKQGYTRMVSSEEYRQARQAILAARHYWAQRRPPSYAEAIEAAREALCRALEDAESNAAGRLSSAATQALRSMEAWRNFIAAEEADNQEAT